MMDEQDPAAGQRREQATQWFARLKTVPVSKGTLEDFFEWRRDPANAEAFAEVEALWGEAARISARPAMLRLVGEAMARGHRPRFRWPLVSGLAFGAFLLVAVIADRWWMAEPAPSLDAATAVGEQRTFALSDGSQVRLNTDTRLDARLGASERRITLDRGEALFDVAHDGARPFLVSAGDVTVRATGTRFDIRHDSAGTLVQLFEGGVDIAVSGQPAAHLRPGQAWRSEGGAAQAIQRIDARRALAWTKGRVVFEATPLGDAVAEINRYTGQKVVLAAGGPANAPISGSFTTGDPDGFVKAVSAMLSLEVEHDPGGGFTLRAKEAGAP